jgi:hypothetical protein
MKKGMLFGLLVPVMFAQSVLASQTGLENTVSDDLNTSISANHEDMETLPECTSRRYYPSPSPYPGYPNPVYPPSYSAIMCYAQDEYGRWSSASGMQADEYQLRQKAMNLCYHRGGNYCRDAGCQLR